MKLPTILFFAGLAALTACTKSGFLSEKPSTALVVPSSLKDLQALMEDNNVFTASPVLGELSSGDYYLPYTTWQALFLPKEQNAYIWAPDLYAGQGNIFDWNKPYQQVFYANVVLDGLAGIPQTPANQADWNTAEGSAEFLRAYAFYNLLQVFAPPYDSTTAGSDLGIPLKLSPDVNQLVQRSSVQASYEQVLRDANDVVKLLPASLPALNRNRPSRPAAYALLARVYLSMGAYAKAGLYADSSLKLYGTLQDYNTLSTASTYQFTNLCPEALYQSAMCYLQTTGIMVALVYQGTTVDSTLYRSYDANDLRKTVFFKTGTAGNINIRPNYAGITTSLFTGPATDEMYLDRAECFARQGNTALAMKDLNTLLVNRYRTGSFTPLSAGSPADALALILQERRKELCFRGLRWTDIRRLNKEGANIILQRVLNGQTYTLAPNSPLYALPIPPDEISLSGLQQNPR